MKQFLIVSNLLHHPQKEFYANGTPWDVFRKTGEENLKNLARFCTEEIDWEIQCASQIIWENLDVSEYDSVIISGSPYNIDEDQAWITNQQQWLKHIAETKTHPPILGVCFGHQLIAKVLGGEIDTVPEYLIGEVAMRTEDEMYVTYANHEQYISKVPEGATVLGYGPHEIPYVIEYRKNLYGIQCHPERKVACPLSEGFWEKTMRGIFET